MKSLGKRKNLYVFFGCFLVIYVYIITYNHTRIDRVISVTLYVTDHGSERHKREIKYVSDYIGYDMGSLLEKKRQIKIPLEDKDGLYGNIEKAFNDKSTQLEDVKGYSRIIHYEIETDRGVFVMYGSNRMYSKEYSTGTIYLIKESGRTGYVIDGLLEATADAIREYVKDA